MWQTSYILLGFECQLSCRRLVIGRSYRLDSCWENSDFIFPSIPLSMTEKIHLSLFTRLHKTAHLFHIISILSYWQAEKSNVTLQCLKTWSQACEAGRMTKIFLVKHRKTTLNGACYIHMCAIQSFYDSLKCIRNSLDIDTNWFCTVWLNDYS